MSDGNRQRPAIDLDDLERQLRAVAQPKAAPRSLPPEPNAMAAPAPFAVKPVFAAKLPENESFSEADAEPVPAPQPAKPASRPADYDPLAELARIAQSGSDWATPRPISGSAAQAPNPAPAVSAVDALEALLRMDPPVKAPPPSFAPLPPRRIEPELAPATPQPEPSLLDFAEAPPPATEPAGAYPQAPLYGAAAAEAEPIYAPEGQLPPHDAAFLQEEPQPRSRTGLKLAMALMGVAAIGIGGVFVWRGNDSLPGSGGPRTPPLIKASGEPNKVAPQNPGGMEVPNANQEVFAGSKTPAGPAGPSKVVSSEEQPIDVGQATKPSQPRVILPNGGSAATVPPAPPPPVSTVPRQANSGQTAQPTPAPIVPSAPNAAAPGVAAPGVAALGEPKKVRTVLVRPDGTVIDGTEPTRPPAMSAPQSVMPSSPVPTQTLPPAAAAPPLRGAPPPAIVPVSPAAPAPAPMPAAVEASPQPAPAGTPLPPRRPAASAVAAAEPAPAVARPTQAPPVLAPAVSAAPAPQPAPAQQAAPAPQQTASVGTGDFAVQLAAPPTEQEARSLAARLTQRFGDALGGQEPDIIRAEVNGKTLYRVRVTGLDRESANTMCNRIKSAQGSCFVAKN
jgi:hypothetical protein